MLAWVCTIHKVEGLTLQKICLSLDLQKQRNFNEGQLYVALSNATSISNLSLLGNLSLAHVYVNQAWLDQYSYLRANANCISPIKFSENLFLALLNIRGLLTNMNNFIGDKSFQVPPFICLTRTYLPQISNIAQVESDLQEYHIIFSNSINKYEGIGILYRPNLQN